MNIAAIYDKYDLWGKVRVSKVVFQQAGNYFSVWKIVIAGRNFLSPTPSLIESIKRYTECEHCEGTGEVSAPHYTKGGEAPDCDFEKCKHCNGTGERNE